MPAVHRLRLQPRPPLTPSQSWDAGTFRVGLQNGKVSALRATGLNMRRSLALIFIFAFGFAIYSLHRGIYVGSLIWFEPPSVGTPKVALENGPYVNDPLPPQPFAYHKACRYLFLTGVSSIPARGDLVDSDFSRQASKAYLGDGSALHCTTFAE